MSLRLIFMGTPDFAVPVLVALVGQGHEIACVYTRAPARSGRGMDLHPSPVHAAALRLGIPVETPASLRDAAAAERFAAHGADVAVVVAYGMILPRVVLSLPKDGCLNLHASLLPRWRGAAPINRAIMSGDAETGVAVMAMEEGLDTGPVAMIERVRIGPAMDAGELHDMLSRLGADLMVRALAALSRGSLHFLPQKQDGVTYARKITNAECRIDWRAPALVVHNHIRGLAPFPGAFAELDLGHGPERLKILRSMPSEGQGEPGTVLDGALTVACGEGAVRLLTVQRAGAKPLMADAFLRGVALGSGARFLSVPA